MTHPVERFLTDFRAYSAHREAQLDVLQSELRAEIRRAERQAVVLRDGRPAGCWLMGRVRHGVTEITRGAGA